MIDDIEQGLARKHLAGKLWTIQDLEIAAEVESGQAKELVLEWEQQEIVHQAHGGYYFVDAPPPALPQPQAGWSRRDTVMAVAGVLAVVVFGDWRIDALPVVGDACLGRSHARAGADRYHNARPDCHPHAGRVGAA